LVVSLTCTFGSLCSYLQAFDTAGNEAVFGFEVEKV